VSDSTQPTLQDVLDALARLADRVAASPRSRLDAFVSTSLRRATTELRRWIPGLDAPPDPEAARFLVRAAYAALEDGDSREALARALRGLSFSPHHPGLWFVAASACFEYGAVEDAVRLLRHTLWIHPGHTAARRDLEALTAYLRERWEQPGELAAEAMPGPAADAPFDPELAFDHIEDAPEPPSTDDDDGQDRAA
jgi:hypothetical protein